jgi:hypothetical protein
VGGAVGEQGAIYPVLAVKRGTCMGTRFLPLHPTDTAYWVLLTCPQHTAGDLEIKREGNFLEVRC